MEKSFIIRKRQLKSDFQIKRQLENSVVNSEMNQPTLPNIPSKNLKSKDIKCRLYTALLCSIIGIFVVNIFLLILDTRIYMALA